ncbi:hypothetical protein ACTVCO_08490 [Sanguibacter sp. A247]|uniref:hypothetical protein n=1 Tax=unclassified Sanguibacter TaxID=2645534 RepID=UPI003FD7C244
MDITPNTPDTPPAQRDPFAEFEDETPADAAFTRSDLLGKAKRGFVRLRKDFVQREAKPRPSVLADLVGRRSETALDLLLTVHALQPILDETPLDIKVWARMLGDSVTVRRTSNAFKTLEEMDLLSVDGKRGTPEVALKRENGDGKPWKKDREEDPAERGRGFFALPFDYWTEGLIDSLNLPGKAMLLVMLKETQDPNGGLTFAMAHERAQEFYGFSERTAERGYLELRRQGLMAERRKLVKSGRHPLGYREEWHRALVYPYSTDHRENLRIIAAKAARGTAGAAP